MSVATTLAPLENRLLARLAPDIADALRGEMTTVTLRRGDVLVSRANPLTHVYFPCGGACAVVTVMRDGRTVELAVVGSEGLIGLEAILGGRTAIEDVVVQIASSAYRMAVPVFHQLLQEAPAFRELMIRYAMAQIAAIMQSTGCNALHAVEQRLARWLLATHDRVGADTFALTQDQLATSLGVRRPTVSLAAAILQKSGLIAYRRGVVRILQRQQLEEAACECYDVVRETFARLDVPLARERAGRATPHSAVPRG
jgi:CRP-like cAMP-binding protein